VAQLRIPLDKKLFESGLRWPDFLAQMGDYRERTAENYAKCVLNDEERTFFGSLKQTPYGLMIAENWCGDVHRNSPMLARIADAIPGFEMRVLARDQHLEVADCFMYNGYRSIPIMVFFDKDWNEIGHWVERPSRANTIGASVRAKTIDAAPADQKEAAMAEYRKRMADAYDGPEGLWRDTVREVKQVLETRLGLLPKEAKK
jgi:Thioredoxin